jgi:hypothetical protein
MYDQFSLVQLPHGDIYLTGGVAKNGSIQSKVLMVNTEHLNIISKEDMLVKRVGHSVCYVPPI